MDDLYGKADIHIHTDYSDGLHDPMAVINYAVSQTDLQVIAITDHNTIAGAQEAYDYWRAEREHFRPIEVIKGIEVSSSAGHILGLFVEEDIAPHMSPAETVRAIREQGGLAIAAHPFTHLMPFTDLEGIGREIGALSLDGVEVRNSAPTELYANWLTANYNRRHRNHAMIGGSDTHYLTMMGRTYTRFPGKTAAALRQAIQQKLVRPGGQVTGPMVVFQVIVHLLRRRQLPVFLPDDHSYRQAGTGLAIEVVEQRDAPVAILYCVGELTRINSKVLATEAQRLMAGQIIRLVIDLSDIRFMDSNGMGKLITLHKETASRGGGLALSSPNKTVGNIMRMARMDKVLRIYPNPLRAKTALLTNRA